MIASLRQDKILTPGLKKEMTQANHINPKLINASYPDKTKFNLRSSIAGQMKFNKNPSISNNLKKMSLNVYSKRNNINNATRTSKKILGICHIGNPSTFIKMEKYINNLLNINASYVNYSITLIAALITSLPAEFVNYVKLKYPQIIFIETPNAGFDIGSFFNILKYCKENNLECDYVIKVHTKTDDEWRNIMLNSLAGSTNDIHKILKNFEDPTIGLICDGKINCMNIGSPSNKNYIHLKYLIEKFNIDIRPNVNVRFAAGTMFWVRYSILKQIFWECDFNNILEDFNSVDTFDWNWYKRANIHTINKGDINSMNTKDAAYKHYLQCGQHNNLSPNLFHAIKHNTRSEKLRDAMIEHAYERFFSYMVVSLKYKQYFIINK